MNCGHLFNGISGFGLAASWMNWINYMHCEIDPFCNKVMKKHFPNSIEHGDIKTVDFTVYRGIVDVITGGDPCQPSSRAGKRKGKEDGRYLWPEYRRCIEEIRPKIIVNENVPGTIENGILDEKINDLEALGYSWWPPIIIPASATGAPHRRDRVWLVAYLDIFGQQGGEQGVCEVEKKRYGSENSFAMERTQGWLRNDIPASTLMRMDDGIPNGLDRVAALGNSILPQIAFELFKIINSELLNK